MVPPFPSSVETQKASPRAVFITVFQKPVIKLKGKIVGKSGYGKFLELHVLSLTINLMIMTVYSATDMEYDIITYN